MPAKLLIHRMMHAGRLRGETMAELSESMRNRIQISDPIYERSEAQLCIKRLLRLRTVIYVVCSNQNMVDFVRSLNDENCPGNAIY